MAPHPLQDPISLLHEVRAQDSMAGHHQIEGHLQPGQIQGAMDSKAGGEVVGGGIGLHQVGEPEAVLQLAQATLVLRRSGRQLWAVCRRPCLFPANRPLEQLGAVLGAVALHRRDLSVAFRVGPVYRELRNQLAIGMVVRSQ